MDITRQTLDALFTGFNKSFQGAFNGIEPSYKAIATLVTSTTAKESYPWLGSIKGMREWIGDRQMQKLGAHDYSIVNRKWEDTVEVLSDKIDDDSFGIYKPMFEMLGQAAADHPDKLVFEALVNGFTQPCYDGQNFFDTDHPVGEVGEETTVSNMQAGAGEPWFLLSTNRPLKPLIFQERKKANKLKRKDRDEDDNKFFRDSYIYGVDGRYNVGYGFWQMAYASKDVLNEANFKAARTAIRNLKNDHGEPLGLQPSLIVVGNGNADAAEDLLTKEKTGGGDTNTLRKAVEVLLSARIN